MVHSHAYTGTAIITAFSCYCAEIEFIHRVIFFQIQKSAIRVCGDWSEHLSSSGKKYYYNCTTEVSQWEKPKEWLEM